MNWQEIAGSLVNALRNAGVKKDVIDLQEKHIGMLTGEIETLSLKLSESTTEIANLRTKITKLEKELEHLRPREERLLDVQEGFLKALHKWTKPTSLDHIASILRLDYDIVDIHRVELEKMGMIRWSGRGSGDWGQGLPAYEVTSKGKAYLEKHKLA
jgi:hypothetical protein